MKKKNSLALCLAIAVTSFCGAALTLNGVENVAYVSADTVSGYEDAMGNTLEMTYDANGVSTQEVYKNGAEIAW